MGVFGDSNFSKLIYQFTLNMIYCYLLNYCKPRVKGGITLNYYHDLIKFETYYPLILNQWK